MQPDYDKILYSSHIPAYMQVEASSFTLNISGTISAGATRVYTTTHAVDITNGSMKLYFTQNTVPSGLALYNSSTLVPVPPAGLYGAPVLSIGASVAGNPSVTELIPITKVSLASGGITVRIEFENPYAGTATLTNTTLTFYYRVYAPTFEP